MSDYTAIAGVSRTLRTLLLDRMADRVDVTIAPPDVEVSGSVGTSRVNLYLYKVTENGWLKNQEIPGRGHPGAYGQPPLSLDLHYLLTAHGEGEGGVDADLEAQQIMGDAMRTLHDFSIITDSLTITRPEVGTVGDPVLDDSLIGEFEKAKVTFQPMSLDDFSKLWTALGDTKLRRSVAYQVSVVQIESQQRRHYPKLVGEPEAAGPRVASIPIGGPKIDRLCVIRDGDPTQRERTIPYARIGDSLVLTGRSFGAEGTRVFLGPVDATDSISDSRADRIVVTVPSDEELSPGAQPVFVSQDVELGDPPEPHLGFRSNLAVFMLIPRVDNVDKTTAPETLIVTGSGLFTERLECMTLLGSRVIAAEAYLRDPAAEPPIAPTSIEIRIGKPGDLPPGTYPLRVRVNGAESIDDVTVELP